MAKPIYVKIATSKVIKSLEEKLAQLNKDKANEAKYQDNYQKAMEKWRAQVIKIAVANVSKASNTSLNERYDGTINLDFYFNKGALDVPPQPEREGTTLHDWQYKEMVEEIESAIRILKMTDEETVNASTMKSISKYL